MSEPKAESELALVLAALETRRTLPVNHEVRKLSEAAQDAHRLLRALARDFGRYAEHHFSCVIHDDEEADCSCGLDATRARWRLPS